MTTSLPPTSKGPGLYDDAFGRIFLNSLDMEGHSWSAVLTQVNLAMVYDKQEKLKMIRLREGVLANRFGFKLFCADYSKIRPVEYVAFLERMDKESLAYVNQLSQAELAKSREWNHSNLSVIVCIGILLSSSLFSCCSSLSPLFFLYLYLFFLISSLVFLFSCFLSSLSSFLAFLLFPLYSSFLSFSFSLCFCLLLCILFISSGAQSLLSLLGTE